MEYTNYTDTIRIQCVKLLTNELDNPTKSRKIEKSIYNTIIQYAKVNNIKRNWDNIHFKSLYLARIRSIYTNLKTTSYLHNTEFKAKILSNEIECETISQLSH